MPGDEAQTRVDVSPDKGAETWFSGKLARRACFSLQAESRVQATFLCGFYLLLQFQPHFSELFILVFSWGICQLADNLISLGL